MKELT